METLPTQSELEDLFLETAGELAESFSLNRAVVQLYALLYMRPEPVSLDEMTERLKISKGSVSINIRILEDWNAAKKILVQGSRKDFYTAEPDFFKIIAERLQHGLSKRLNLLDRKFALFESKVQSNSLAKNKELIEFYKTRFNQLKEMQNLIQGLLVLLPNLHKIKGWKAFKTLISLK